MDRSAFVLVVTLLACRRSADVTRAPSAEGSGERPRAPLAATKLSFVAKGKKLPVPLVRARVAGADTLLIVDTGATHTVLTSSFASARGLATTSASTGTDHSGNAVSVGTLGHLEIVLGGYAGTVDDAATIAAPPPFDPLGIGGFLSPHTFARRGYVVLDFAHDELLIVDEDEVAVRARVAERAKAPASVLRRVVANGAERKVLVEASLDGGPPTVAEIDTGGSTTEFASGAGGGTSGELGTTASGAVVEGAVAEGRTVHLGSLSFGPMPVGLRSFKVTEQQPYKAVLGIDILVRCVVAVPVPSTAGVVIARAR